jgi:hypothetical protein
MSWHDEMQLELARAGESERSGNAGRVRTCLRRAIGHAVTEWQRRDPSLRWGHDFLRQLQGLAADAAVPEEVRGAADRLASRLGTDFRSRSANPMEDARTVLAFVLEQMGEPPEFS